MASLGLLHRDVHSLMLVVRYMVVSSKIHLSDPQVNLKKGTTNNHVVQFTLVRVSLYNSYITNAT